MQIGGSRACESRLPRSFALRRMTRFGWGEIFLDFRPQLGAWIFRIQFCQFAEQFFRPLVARHGHGHGDLDDLIPARAFLRCRGHTLFPQAQLLSGLRSRRNLQQRPAVDRGHFDLRSQSGFGRAYRDSQIDVVSVAPEDRMLFSSDDRIKIARWAAVDPGIPLARNANPLSVTRASLDAHFERLRFRHRAFTMAGGTRRQILARPVASRTLHVELHPSAGLGDVSRSVALRTFAWRLQETLPVTVRANVLTGNIQAHHAAADRRPERDVYLIFQIAPRLGTDLRGSPGALPSAEDRAEDVAEAAPAPAFAATLGAVDQLGEIESAQVERN